MKYKELEALSVNWNGKVCIFGAGINGRTWAYDILTAAGFTINFYCDNNLETGTEIQKNVFIDSLEQLYNLSNDVLVFIAVSERNQDTIHKQLAESGINNIIDMGYEFYQEFMDDILLENNSNVLKKYELVVDDRKYLERQFRLRCGYELNLDQPHTFNEKIQWLKINVRDPQYSMMADKIAVKSFVSDIVGKKYVLPILGIWESAEDIDISALPDEFVLKCNHNSGLGMYICRDKKALNWSSVKNEINAGLKQNYYLYGREWCYKNIKPKVFAEPLLKDGKHIVPEDYKIYCFNGKPKYIVVFHNRFDETKKLYESVYDLSWNKLNVSFDNNFAISDWGISKPDCLDEMLDVCGKLCKNMKMSRIDFYIVDEKVYFGEITLYTASGFAPMIPEEIDLRLGEQLIL